MEETPSSFADQILPDWFLKWRRPVFSYVVSISTMGLAIACIQIGHQNNDNIIAYIIAFILALVCIPLECAVDRRNPELTKDLRFDLAGALIAYGIIRIEATRRADHIYFNPGKSLQIFMDLYFFFVFVGAKLVGRTGTREVALLVMADIVDFVELTFSIRGDEYVNKPTEATQDAIVCFTFIFILVTLLIHRAETPGQRALNAIVQGLMVHLPIIFIRGFIGIGEGAMPSFNVIFIAKNVLELMACILDFLEAGTSVSNSGAAYAAVP
eukprot:m.21635 g.21635  ORF g.21635 m.21635 type:complete len:269 (-) comp13489_c0_seq1:435-1241(-)